MVVWIQNPFDSLPLEGSRKMRYWLMGEAFVRAGWRVVLWTSDFSHATKKRRVIEATGATTGASGTSAPQSLTTPASLATQNFEVRLVPTRPYARNVSFARVLSHRAYAREWLRLATSEGAREKPDLIVTSMPTISGASAALTLGRRFGAKVVVDVMDAWPETFERLVPHLALWPLRRTARRIYRDADFVTGVCARYRELTGRSDYYLAYHGIEVGERGAIQPIQPTSHLIYSGNLGRTYDLETLVAVVGANPRLTLDVAGFGAFASSCPRIRFHGFLSEAGLQALFASCDIGVVPMAPDSWVGVPYKFADYSRAGLRIVSSLGGESSALLEKYRCGATYRVGDAASLAAAIEAAAKLPKGASRRLCEAEFDATRIYDAYVQRVSGQ